MGPDSGIEYRGAKTQTASVMLVPCHHIGVFQAPWPTEGQTVYCRRCLEYRDVESTLKSYRCRCNTRARCRVTRDHGDDINSARAMASEHVLRYPSHVVEIMCNYQPVEFVRYGQDPSEHPYASLGGARQLAADISQESLREVLDKRYREAQARRVPPNGADEAEERDSGEHRD